MPLVSRDTLLTIRHEVVDSDYMLTDEQSIRRFGKGCRCNEGHSLRYWSSGGVSYSG